MNVTRKQIIMDTNNDGRIDPVYCSVIIKRWEDYTGKKAILEEPQHD